MALTVIDSDLRVNGDLSAETMVLAANSVTNSNVKSDAAVAVTKTQHLVAASTDFGIAADAAPSATVKKVIFTANGACTIRNFKATLRDTGTSSSLTFDLQKATAGSATLTTALSAVISFTHSDTDNTPKSGSLSTTTLAAGDMLVAVMNYTSATGVLGPLAFCDIDTAAN